MGTGPFKFEKWDKDQQIVLVKNKSYWGKQALVDKVVFKVTKENSVRASELLTGAIDIMDGVDVNDVKTLESKRHEDDQEPRHEHQLHGLLLPQETLQRPAAPPGHLHGHQPGGDREIPLSGLRRVGQRPAAELHSRLRPKLEPLPYNPEQAKKLLADAGYKDFSFTFITYSNPRPYNPATGVKLAEAVQADLLKIGVKTHIKAYPWTEYKPIAAAPPKATPCSTAGSATTATPTTSCPCWTAPRSRVP